MLLLSIYIMGCVFVFALFTLFAYHEYDEYLAGWLAIAALTCFLWPLTVPLILLGLLIMWVIDLCGMSRALFR